MIAKNGEKPKRISKEERRRRNRIKRRRKKAIKRLGDKYLYCNECGAKIHIVDYKKHRIEEHGASTIITQKHSNFKKSYDSDYVSNLKRIGNRTYKSTCQAGAPGLGKKRR